MTLKQSSLLSTCYAQALVTQRSHKVSPPINMITLGFLLVSPSKIPLLAPYLPHLLRLRPYRSLLLCLFNLIAWKTIYAENSSEILTTSPDLPLGLIILITCCPIAVPITHYAGIYAKSLALPYPKSNPTAHPMGLYFPTMALPTYGVNKSSLKDADRFCDFKWNVSRNQFYHHRLIDINKKFL